MSLAHGSTGQTGPAQVLIIRHAEKLVASETGGSGGPNLSLKGSARAAALPMLFCPGAQPRDCAMSASGSALASAYGQRTATGTVPRFPRPDFVFATAACQSSDRELQTVSPLLAAFGLAADIRYEEHDYGRAVAEILGESKYAGKVVLICWHHGQIRDIAIAFGVADPPYWKRDVFDRVWQLTWSDSGGPPAFADLPQQLLFGDSAA
jgi:broad specificity phosphatase PhoE